MAVKRGRLDPDFLERVVAFTIRVLRVAERLERDRRPKRVIDQLIGAGSSPGAQAHEADAAMSTRDFIKSLGIATKELSECRYWLKVIAGMAWIEAEMLAGLIDESQQIARIMHAMIVRSRP